MKLTIDLTGQGTLESTHAPDLGLVPGIAENFKIRESTQETTGGTRRFTYTVRPKNAEITQFPAVLASYFDVNRGRYVSLHSQPIPIEVTPAEVLSDSDIIAAPRAGGSLQPQLRTRTEGIFANVTDPRDVRNELVWPGRWFGALAGLLALYAVVAVVSLRWQRAGRDIAGRRRRGASARARSRLKEAFAAKSAGNVRPAADHVQGTIAGLIADVADLPEVGVTLGDVRRQLTEFGTDPALIDRVDDLLKTCDAARYGSLHAGKELQREATVVLEKLIASFKAQRRFR
jgi:hypothetical protein